MPQLVRGGKDKRPLNKANILLDDTGRSVLHTIPFLPPP